MKKVINVVVVIPWKKMPSRVGPLKELLLWYKNNLPGIQIIFANASEEIWLPSASRNLGVKKAQEAGADVIIINDADTLPEIEPLLEAIEYCQRGGMIHNPYSHCKVFSKEETFRYYDGARLQDIHCMNIASYSNGGIYVCTPEAWWSIGGMDEKFVQWGYEDSAFETAHTVIKGVKIVKHTGYIYSLKHQEQFHDKNYNDSEERNRQLYMRYLKIADPEEMLALVKQKTINE